MSANLYFAILLIMVAAFFFFVFPVNISPLDYLDVLLGKDRIICNSTDQYYCYYANTTTRAEMPASLFESVRKCTYAPSPYCSLYTVLAFLFAIIGFVGLIVVFKEIFRK